MLINEESSRSNRFHQPSARHRDSLLFITVPIFSSVQSLSRVRLSATPWVAARQASLSITNSWSLLKLMIIESVMPSNHLILLSPSPLTFTLSQHQNLPMSQLFISGGQSIVVSASASVLAMNIQDWSPLGWTDWIFLQSKGLSRVFSNTTVQKKRKLSFLYSPTFTYIHDYWKNHSLDQTDLCWQRNVCFLICCLGWS